MRARPFLSVFALGLIAGLGLVQLAGSTPLPWPGGVSLEGARLSGASLRGQKLPKCNLANADLSDADLAFVDFREANLAGADLSRALLSGADLRAADLQGADLSGTNLEDTDLRGAILEGARYDGETTWPAGLLPEAFGAVPAVPLAADEAVPGPLPEAEGKPARIARKKDTGPLAAEPPLPAAL